MRLVASGGAVEVCGGLPMVATTVGKLFPPSTEKMCRTRNQLYGGECISFFPHTNYFFGNSKIAHEPISTENGPKHGPWVHEGGASRKT